MTDTNGFVVAAYIVMWVGVIGYFLRLHRTFRDARRRLDEASHEGRTT